MLLPDNIQPELTLYYNGAIVIKELARKPNQKILDLYENIKNNHNMSFSIFILSLDWLYVIDYAEIDEEGIVRKCL
jgi:hypothetical protein